MISIIEKYKSIIINYDVIKWEVEPISYRFIAVILFTDKSKLFIRDYLFSDKRKYSYHWQDKNEKVLIRWDNAPHWIDIATYPFHKHKAGKVLPSTKTTLEDILEYINQISL